MRRFVQLGLSCALSLCASGAVGGCSVSPDAGNPDNVGALPPPPMHVMVSVPRDPRATTFDLQRDGGSDLPDRAVLDAGTPDEPAPDGADQEAVDAGQPTANAQLDAVVASFNASVELECACLWSAPGYRYDSQSTCVAVGRLDPAQASCVRAQLVDAHDDVLECKLAAERELRACLSDGCTEAAALACVQGWAEADEACDPGLAAKVYDACLTSDA